MIKTLTIGIKFILFKPSNAHLIRVSMEPVPIPHWDTTVTVKKSTQGPNVSVVCIHVFFKAFSSIVVYQNVPHALTS